jgi:plastocyanin
MPFDPALEQLNNFLEDVPQGPEVPRPCGQFPYHQSIDLSDPTMSEANAGFQWNVTAGPSGTIVDRYQIDDVTDQSAGGLAQNVFAVPYYRDDACFDDGTGTNPGRKVRLRSSDEPQTYIAPDGSTQPRECWRGQEEDLETERYYQGSIGTHGLHILMIAESDNARTTVPVTELVAEQRMVMLPGEGDITVGEQYGRGFEKPLVAIAVPEQRSAAANEPPSASFEYTPAEPQTSRPVNFDSTSEDADDGIASLDWDLDGDGQFDDAQGDQVTHTFTTVGEHSVGLRATDASGDTATAQRTVTVTNPPPTGSISYSPSSPRPRQTVTFTGTGSDENGSVTGFAWDLDSDGAFDDGSSSQATRSFPSPGNYPVALRLTDNDGASTVVEAVVRVGKGKAR